MAITDYLLSGGFSWSPYLGRKSNDWYSGLQTVDKNSYTSNLVSGELTDAYGKSTASLYNTSQYSPVTSRMSASDVEKLDYYQAFGNGITRFDINDENSAFNHWAKDYDKNYLGGSRNESSFFDENGQLRNSWKHYDSATGKWITVNTAKEHFERLSRDGKLGSGHNIYYGKRYFYKDKNGQQIWVNPTDINKYLLSDAVRGYDNGAVWDDYEITGLKDNFIDNLGIDYSKKPNNPIQNPETFTGETPTSIKETEPLKQNKLSSFLPDVLASSRLFLTLRNNRKVHDIYNLSIRPVLKDTYERYSPITGDFGMLSLKNQLAATTLSLASRPFTSDASLTAARLAEAQSQANRLQTEGYLADNQRIRETAREALLRQEDNMARRSEVANFNRALLQDVRERKAENDALTLKADWQSLDLYLQGFEKRFRAEATKRENDINDWNNLIILQNAKKYQDFKYREILNKVRALEAQYGYNIPEIKLLEIQQELSKLQDIVTDYQYLLKAKLEGIPYSGIYNKNQRNSWKVLFKSGGKFVPKFLRGSSIGNALGIYQDISGSYYDTITLYELQRRYGGTEKSSSKSSKKSDSSSSDKGDFTRKDFINAIKDAKLLPNDVNALYLTVTGLFNRVKMMGADVSDISQLYLLIMPMLNNAKMNRERYDEIEKKLRNEGKLYELAYYQSGVYATDGQTGKIVHISREQLNEDKQRYNPITYGQLLWCTLNMPELAYNHSWLEAASSAISLKDVMDLLKNNIYKLGTDTTKIDYFGTNLQYALSFKELKHLLAAPEGYYKLTQLLKNPTQQGGGIAGLFNAAMTMLPEAAKGRLKFATQSGTGEELYGLITQMLMGQLDYTSELSLSPVTTVDENGRIRTKSKSSSKEEDPIEGFWRSVQALRGDNYLISIIKDKGRLSATGNIYTSIPNIDKNMSLSDFLYKSGGMNLVSDKSAISFGDIKLDQKSLSDIMVDSSSNFVTVMLPKNPDGSVDFGVLDEYLEIKDSNPNNYLLLMQNAGLGYLYNSDGTPNLNQFGLFLVVEGLASDKTLGINKEGKPASLKDVESNYTIKYKNDREMLNKLILGLSSKENGEYELNDTYNIWNPFDHIMDTDAVYEGNIYIPISKSPIKASWADETKIKTSVAKDYDLMLQTKEKESIMNNDTELD